MCVVICAGTPRKVLTWRVLVQTKSDWVTETDEYDEEARLPAKVRALARAELREDATARRQALQQMRDWLRKNPRIVNCRLGETISVQKIFVKLQKI